MKRSLTTAVQTLFYAIKNIVTSFALFFLILGVFMLLLGLDMSAYLRLLFFFVLVVVVVCLFRLGVRRFNRRLKESKK